MPITGGFFTGGITSTYSDKSIITHVDEANTFISPKRTAEIALLLEGKNAFMGRLEINPGASVPVHRDGTEEYLYVLRGGGQITIDGKTTSIGRGHAVYMPANAEVSFINNKRFPTKLVQFFAGPSPAAKYLSWKGRVPKVAKGMSLK